MVVDDETDVTKIIGAFCNYADAPNRYSQGFNVSMCIFEIRAIREGKF